MKKFKKIIHFTIITIHNGNISDLKKTIKSVDLQTVKPKKHLIISPILNIDKIKKFRKKFRKFILGKDKSIYNAMNIGIKNTKNDFILFLNSGDTMFGNKTIKNIKNKIKEKKCYIFQTQLKYKNTIYTPKKSFFSSKNYYPHPSFIRPPEKKTKILFNENFNILSDGIWMTKNIKKYGSVKKRDIISTHYLGGVSSKPNAHFLREKFRLSLLQGIKEFVKFLLFIIFTEKNYYKIIFKYKFDKKY